ncbi:MAG: tetratricopeptide repeat protein [Myxococcota bacterium]
MRRWSALAAVLLLSNATTWAWSSGRLDRAIAAWSAPPAPASTSAGPPAPGIVPAVSGEAAAPPPTVATPTVSLPGTPTVERAARSARARPAAADAPAAPAPTSTAPPSTAPTPTAPPSGDSADREAFERAHRAHFDGVDTAAALAAWDAYLAAFPEGRFLPEATFNRAICLLRLGRPEDARVGLERIASGDLGAAHRDDARTLLLRPEFQ